MFEILTYIVFVWNVCSWATVLEERERVYLRHFLPETVGLDEEVDEGFLDRLLRGDETINFGNPSKWFMRDILSGRCHPNIVKFRNIISDLEFGCFFMSMREKYNADITKLIEHSNTGTTGTTGNTGNTTGESK